MANIGSFNHQPTWDNRPRTLTNSSRFFCFSCSGLLGMRQAAVGGAVASSGALPLYAMAHARCVVMLWLAALAWWLADIPRLHTGAMAFSGLIGIFVGDTDFVLGDESPRPPTRGDTVCDPRDIQRARAGFMVGFSERACRSRP